MDKPIEIKEIGDYRINIYYDTDARCPCTDWDMVACYLWDYPSYNGGLSSACNWEDVFGKYGKNKYNLADALHQLVNDHVKWEDLLKYFKKGKLESYQMRYDRSENLWYLEWCVKNGVYDEILSVEPSELYSCDLTGEFIENLEVEELVQILNDLGGDIYVKEWSSSGYRQGDYVSGVAYCTKERFKKRVSEDTTDWKKRADAFIDGGAEAIGMWMWGDVKGFTLEHKVSFTKVYDDTDREDEEDYDWEEIDSCWGYFMSTDELIDEVISEHDLKESRLAC